jgi:predicted DNA binding CopG/RHH family protein
MKLTKREQAIENAVAKGHYTPVHPSEFEQIAEAVARRKKEAVLSIRINKQDLESLKKKAKQFNIPYQSFISEILHRYAS